MGAPTDQLRGVKSVLRPKAIALVDSVAEWIVGRDRSRCDTGAVSGHVDAIRSELTRRQCVTSHVQAPKAVRTAQHQRVISSVHGDAGSEEVQI